MTYSILISAQRKDGTTPAQFADYYENSHVPLIKEITGDTFPLTHTRTYIARSEDAANGYPASVLIGTPADFNYDAFAELTWENQEEFGKFVACVSQPENAKRIQEDEENFINRSKLRAVIKGKTNVTSK